MSYFMRDVPVINGAMRSQPDIFKRGVMFAVLSIRVQFHRMPDIVAEYDRNARDAWSIWGNKIATHDYVTAHLDNLYVAAIDARQPGDCIAALCAVPGISIIKAAFVAQMLGHDVVNAAGGTVQVNPQAGEGFADALEFTGALNYGAPVGLFTGTLRAEAGSSADDLCVIEIAGADTMPMMIAGISPAVIVEEG